MQLLPIFLIDVVFLTAACGTIIHQVLHFTCQRLSRGKLGLLNFYLAYNTLKGIEALQEKMAPGNANHDRIDL